MSTLNAFYVRAADSQIAATITAKYPKAEPDPDSEYLAIYLSDDEFECPEAELADLSRELDTDVIWLSYVSTVDAFQFFHWQSGRCVRSLRYGCMEQFIWDRADGTAEPWELEAIAGMRPLEGDDEEAINTETKRELEEIYRGLTPAPGRDEPGIDARECAFAVAQHYKLPGYSKPRYMTQTPNIVIGPRVIDPRRHSLTASWPRRLVRAIVRAWRSLSGRKDQRS